MMPVRLPLAAPQVTGHADFWHPTGFFPPPFVRHELYAKAQRLFKSSGGGLF
jgi:hypothetical protein